MKPFRENAFRETVKRIYARLTARDNINQNGNIFLNVTKDIFQSNGLCIKVNGNVIFINYADIKYVEARSYYLVIHTFVKQYLFRETITNFEQRLDSNLYFQVHRSTIVRKYLIQSISLRSGNNFIIATIDGKKFNVSRHRKKHFMKWLST